MGETLFGKTGGAKAWGGRMVKAVIVIAAMAAAVNASKEGLDERINAYAKAGGNVEAVISQNFTLNALVNIPKPKTANATITIRGANPVTPVVIKRGISGNLFNVRDGATLILKDIIIDGDSKDGFKEGGGTLVNVQKGGTLAMNGGAVLRNNAGKNGGGANVSGTLTMDGGEICGNAASNGGGVHAARETGIIVMSNGKITGNSANAGGGVNAEGAFTMTGGEISGNAAGSRANNSGSAVRVGPGGTFNLYGGTVAGTVPAVCVSSGGKYNLNNGSAPAPNNAVVNVSKKSVVGLAILVDFPDERSTATQEELSDFLNRRDRLKNGGSDESVFDYYYEVSNGLMEYTCIVGPSITMPHDKAHYNKIYAKGKLDIYGNFTDFGKEMVAYVLDKLNDMKFDPSGVTLVNNTVVALNLFYVGGKDNPFPGWSQGYGGGITVNGIKFNRYQATPVTPGKITSHGAAIHEIGHMLMGWPDLYDKNLDRPSRTVGRWCMMAGSQGSRTTPNAYFRQEAGWIDAIDITNAAPGTVFSIESNGPKTYVYRRNAQEAYFIEAKLKREGRRDKGLPGSGLAIWHFYAGGSNPNKNSEFPYLALMQADGRNDLANRVNLSDATDLFRLGVKTKFNSKTAPAAVWHDGTPSGLSISRISDSGAVMTFKIGDEDYEDVMPPKYEFYHQISDYTRADKNFEMALDRNLTLDMLVSIPKPQKAGATLTIRSVNPAKPVTLTRGVKGNLITVSDGATLILENIIVDGGGNVKISDDDLGIEGEDKPAAKKFTENSGGTLVYVNKGGAFVMNSGAVLRNNISTNLGGGVRVNGGMFTMNGGEISGNTSVVGAGVCVMGSGGTFNLNGGVIVGTGKNVIAVVYDEHELNNDAVIIVWNKPSGDAPLNYSVGTNTHLTVLPDKVATAVWAIQGDILGISYQNGMNTGFIGIDGMKPEDLR